MAAYKFIVEPNKPVTLLKFTAICKNNGVDFEAARIKSGPRSYRYKLKWQTAINLKPKSGQLKLVV